MHRLPANGYPFTTGSAQGQRHFYRFLFGDLEGTDWRSDHSRPPTFVMTAGATPPPGSRKHRRERPGLRIGHVRGRNGTTSTPRPELAANVLIGNEAGYDIVSGAVKIPSYATVTPAGQSTYVWTTTSSDTRALATPGSNNASSPLSGIPGTSFSIAVNLNDGQAARGIATGKYRLDWDNKRAVQSRSRSPKRPALARFFGYRRRSRSFNGGKYLRAVERHRAM